jgi:hypothetical protein
MVSYLNELESAHPDKDIMEVKSFIDEFEIGGTIFAAPEDGYVLSDESRIYPTVWQAYTRDGQVHEDLQEFMQRRLLVDVTPLLNTYDISLIVIPKDTRDNGFWIEDTERGLKFIMQNSKRFTLLHATQRYEVWLYIPKEGT